MRISEMRSDTRWFQPLATVLGYGSELRDALNRYSGADQEGREHILEGYADWFQNCKHWRILCFADVTFFTQGRSVRDALTIVLTPPLGNDRRGNHEEYVRALQNEYLRSGHTMVPHRVFASGIPFSKQSHDAPQTHGELADFFEQ